MENNNRVSRIKKKILKKVGNKENESQNLRKEINSIGVQVSKKEVGTHQMIIWVVSIRNKDNVIKVRDCKKF